MLICLLLFALLAVPRQAAATDAPAPAKVDAKLHSDAEILIGLMDVRKQIAANIPASLEKSRTAMREKCPACTEAFIEEWVKRMTQQYDLNKIVAAYVSGYESNLTDAEILELIDLQKASNAGQPVTPSPALKARLTAVYPTMQSQIVGQCVQISSKLGAEVGQQIQREHPEMFPEMAPPPAPK